MRMTSVRKCGVCGAGVGPAMEECLRCGASARLASPALDKPRPIVLAELAEPDPTVCRICGAHVHDAVDWCGRCFTPVSGRRTAV